MSITILMIQFDRETLSKLINLLITTTETISFIDFEFHGVDPNMVMTIIFVKDIKHEIQEIQIIPLITCL